MFGKLSKQPFFFFALKNIAVLEKVSIFGQFWIYKVMDRFDSDFRRNTFLKVKLEVEVKVEIENYFTFGCNYSNTFY